MIIRTQIEYNGPCGESSRRYSLRQDNDLRWSWINLVCGRWNPLTMTLQSSRGHHKCKSPVISILNACIWIIEFSVNCLCAVIWIICSYSCMTYSWYELNGLRTILFYISLPLHYVVLCCVLLRWSSLWRE